MLHRAGVPVDKSVRKIRLPLAGRTPPPQKQRFICKKSILINWMK
jgi:hypothetical protein